MYPNIALLEHPDQPVTLAQPAAWVWGRTVCLADQWKTLQFGDTSGTEIIYVTFKEITYPKNNLLTLMLFQTCMSVLSSTEHKKHWSFISKFLLCLIKRRKNKTLTLMFGTNSFSFFWDFYFGVNYPVISPIPSALCPKC